jgi:hypothetical protein
MKETIVVGKQNKIIILVCPTNIDSRYTNIKENKIFLIYKEILNGAVAKSYMTNGLLVYGEIFAHSLIY